jgi:hypothetical protein
VVWFQLTVTSLYEHSDANSGSIKATSNLGAFGRNTLHHAVCYEILMPHFFPQFFLYFYLLLNGKSSVLLRKFLYIIKYGNCSINTFCYDCVGWG